MEDDEFFINDDDLAADNQLSIVDDAKLKVLEYIIKVATEAKDNIKFNESTDASSNISLLSKQMSALISLDSEELEELSDEELYERVEAILRSTTELTLSNIDDVLPKQEDDFDDSGSTNMNADDDDDSGIDF